MPLPCCCLLKKHWEKTFTEVVFSFVFIAKHKASWSYKLDKKTLILQTWTNKPSSSRRKSTPIYVYALERNVVVVLCVLTCSMHHFLGGFLRYRLVYGVSAYVAVKDHSGLIWLIKRSNMSFFNCISIVLKSKLENLVNHLENLFMWPST